MSTSGILRAVTGVLKRDRKGADTWRDTVKPRGGEAGKGVTVCEPRAAWVCQEPGEGGQGRMLPGPHRHLDLDPRSRRGSMSGILAVAQEPVQELKPVPHPVHTPARLPQVTQHHALCYSE